MSNQIFINATDKFYDLPGFNLYRIAATYTIPATLFGPLPIVTAGSTIQGAGLTDITPAGSLVFLKTGVYSLTYKIGWVQETGAADIGIRAYVGLLNGPVIAEFAAQTRGTIAAAFPENIVNLSYTGYFNAGAEVQCVISNRSPVGIQILSSITTLIVCKLS